MFSLIPLFLARALSDQTPPPTQTPEPTRTVAIKYIIKETNYDVYLIVGISVLAVAIVALIILIIVSCVKKQKGDIYSKTSGVKSPQMEAGTVQVKSIYSLKSTQKQYVTSKY